MKNGGMDFKDKSFVFSLIRLQGKLLVVNSWTSTLVPVSELLFYPQTQS